MARGLRTRTAARICADQTKEGGGSTALACSSLLRTFFCSDPRRFAPAVRVRSPRAITASRKRGEALLRLGLLVLLRHDLLGGARRGLEVHGDPIPGVDVHLARFGPLPALSGPAGAEREREALAGAQ